MKGRRQVAKLVAEIRRPSPLAGVKRHPHLVMPQFWARFRRRKKLSRRPYLRPSSRSYDTLRPSIQHSCFSATADISLTARQSERNASIGWLALFNEAERVASSSRSASSACCNKRSTASQTFCNSLANFRDCPRAVREYRASRADRTLLPQSSLPRMPHRRMSVRSRVSIPMSRSNVSHWP